MSERIEIEKKLIDIIKFEEKEIDDAELKLIDDVIQDFAPEIAFLYDIREDESEEQRIKTGRLHENRILGILLKFYFERRGNVTTSEIEDEYKRYFKEIARSTTSTYLNLLKKDYTLKTKRDGRTVYYSFKEEPPIGIKPFWFTRIFCVVPSYFTRALMFSKLYINAENNVAKSIIDQDNEDLDILIRNYKFIIGLIIITIFKNRSAKCVFCQFCKKEIYNMLVDRINDAIHDRSDVLPEEITKNFIEKASEIPLFDGTDIIDDETKENIHNELIKYANLYKKDLDFQIMVSTRRKDVRIKQKMALEEEDGNISNISEATESIE